MDEAKQMVRIQSMQSNRNYEKIKAREAIDEVARAKKEAIDPNPGCDNRRKSCKSESRPSGNGSQRPYQ